MDHIHTISQTNSRLFLLELKFEQSMNNIILNTYLQNCVNYVCINPLLHAAAM